MTENNNRIRLRKVSENEIHGPMDLGELTALATGAYIAPEDEVSYDGEHWVRATEVKELEMDWYICQRGEFAYGPTSKGTLREFLLASEINPETELRHKTTGETSTVAQVLGKETLQEVENIHRDETEEPLEDILESIESAKDLKIRQLETDLENLRTDHEKLMAQYRKASEELLQLKKGA